MKSDKIWESYVILKIVWVLQIGYIGSVTVCVGELENFPIYVDTHLFKLYDSARSFLLDNFW